MTAWTPKEDAIILGNPGSLVRQIAELLTDRSVNSIRGRRTRLRHRQEVKDMLSVKAPRARVEKYSRGRRGERVPPERMSPRNWFAGGKDQEAGAAVFRAAVFRAGVE